MPPTRKLLMSGFRRMLAHFGPRKWWPGETPFEVMVGAILTQNTNWGNVERAIALLKEARVFGPRRLLDLNPVRLASLLRPTGYYRVKATRLRSFLKYFIENYGGSAERMSRKPVADLRCELLAVKGIGQETADSILLYALDKPVFVVDAYTKRILSRHALCADDDGYNDLQEFFTDRLPPDVSIYNEYHALLVETGKNFCRAKPRCGGCPLDGWNLSTG